MQAPQLTLAAALRDVSAKREPARDKAVENLALALLAAAMAAPVRCHWAGRALAGLVFLSYVAYLVHELSEPSGTGFTLRRSASSAFNAFVGLLVIGWPSLTYALRARPAADEEHAADEPDSDGWHGDS